MRSLITAILLSFSFSAFAISWNDLVLGETYELNQEIILKSNSPGSALYHIPVGTKLTHSDLVPLDMINVMLYKFDLPQCPGNEFKAEMEIVPVNGTTPVVEVGVDIAEGCQVEFFFETKDIYTTSIVK